MTRLTGSRRIGVLAALALVVGLTPGDTLAQGGIAVPSAGGELARAEALLREGRVEAAEALYYREARRRPRDPAVRLALGRYLASRGAARVGAVLIEEARFFGASPAVTALYLAPLYTRLGDFKALALLPAAPLSAAERARAEWLARNPPQVAGPETLTVALVREMDAVFSLGSVQVLVGSDTVLAEIDPAARGLVLDTARASSPNVRVFPAEASAVQAGTPAIPAVAPRARLGALTFTNLPVSLHPLRGPTRARIGLDLLARFAPSFQPRDGRLTLRRSGRVPRTLPGERVPLLLEPSDVWVVWEGRPSSLTGDFVARRLHGAKWTLDGKRGEVVLQ
jgi:hypothetical protein